MAKNSSKQLIELNFENNPQLASFFASNDPKEILLSLSAAFGREMELDYVIQHASKIIPIEVKAGKTGTLKSLGLFMETKKSELAVRICSAPPKLENHGYQLLSIPFYLCGQLHRLLS